jgi:NTP pyrophosphatase (non-canonical NTP hydrolase)
MAEPVRLDDLYKMVAHIYSEQNAQRPARETFAHFVEVCGMLAQTDREKKIEDMSVVSALCRALGWYFPLMAKFKVSSVEDLIFRKFPLVCPYCRRAPHVDSVCKTVRGTDRSLDHEAVRKLHQQNSKKRPIGLNQWQQMFRDIYPRNLNDKGRSTLGLLEELGELAEAVRVFDRYPKYFVGESADVFSYLMGFANEYALRLERDHDREFSFEDEFIKRYPGLCVQCGYPVCVCPLIPESTVGRLAKELDIKNFGDMFSDSTGAFAEEASQAANNVLGRLGGYIGLVERLPFDRGETNRALVILCLKLADAVQAENPGVAERLRSAAVKVAVAATYAGSRVHPAEITECVNSIQSMIPSIGLKVDEVSSLASPTLPSRLGLLLKHGAIRVLLVFANPKGTTKLRLDEEERAIKEAIKLSKARDLISLKALPASTVDDLRRELLEEEPDIIHFSGHGDLGAIILETSVGSKQGTSISALAELIGRYPRIKCAILNSCYSMSELVLVAPFTIGMETEIADRTAIEFARGFYDAIGAGRGFNDAAAEGKSNVMLKNLGNGFSLKILPRSPTPS